MCTEWLPNLRLPLTRKQFDELPRHPSFKYEFLRSQVWISPRPKHYHALLNLGNFAPAITMAASEDIQFRLCGKSDFCDLQSVFSSAFAHQQPFASLDEESLQRASKESMDRLFTGEEGPVIWQASFVALDRKKEQLIGASLLTLLPPGDPCNFESYYWHEPPAEDIIHKRQGRPHLTWIFVHPGHKTNGIGSSLLGQSVAELQKLGFDQLFSTFLLGNDSSMLWHWRNGFQLLSYPGSLRKVRNEIRSLNRDNPLPREEPTQLNPDAGKSPE